MNTDKERRAIEYLKAFEPENEPYYLCYSGGKDSDTIRILAEIAGVKYECKHNLTTVDAPETVYYVQKTIGKENIETPPLSMWQLIVWKKYPPTRLARYCCEELKERGGQGRIKITGVRWSESNNRAKNNDFVKILGKPKTTIKAAEKYGVKYKETPKGGIVLNTDNAETRRFVEHCYRTTSTMINSIVDWTDSEVWDFLHYYGCESNPLYGCGARRVGCIGCPLQGFKGMQANFKKYPKYRAAYVRAFDKMITARRESGRDVSEEWSNRESVIRWWVGENPNQITLFDLYEEDIYAN